MFNLLKCWRSWCGRAWTQLGIIGIAILVGTFTVRTLVILALFALIGDRIWWPATNAKPVEQQAGLARHERSAM